MTCARSRFSILTRHMPAKMRAMRVMVASSEMSIDNFASPRTCSPSKLADFAQFSNVDASSLSGLSQSGAKSLAVV